MIKFGTIIAAVLGIVLLIVVLALVASIPVLLLWNWIVPVVFPADVPNAIAICRDISWLQALGISLLCAILFKSSSVSSKSS